VFDRSKKLVGENDSDAFSSILNIVSSTIQASGGVKPRKIIGWSGNPGAKLKIAPLNMWPYQGARNEP
jgi:hypothetical protein